MSGSTTKILSILLLLITIGFTSFGQSKTELEKKKNRLNEDISFSQTLINGIKKDEQKTLMELLIINQQIETRQELISTIQAQVRALNKKIKQKQDLIASMEKDLEKLKEEYAQMIYYAYKNRNAYDKMMFIFSSEDFNQAYKRLKYFQQYTEYRQKQAALIKKTQALLNKQAGELQVKKAEKQSLLNQEHSQKNQLAEEKQLQQNTYGALQKKEKSLKADIRKKEQEKAKLQKAIQRIIAEEIRKAKEAKTKFTLTPEAKELSNNFAKNKSKLPWPVEKGVITGRYGEHPHAVLSGIKIKNNGVDITTTEGSTARAVFDGVVTSIIVIPGVGKAVMVQHGEFFTVYSNLKETFVSQGDKVTIKQAVGTIITDSKKKTELHFEIWQITDIQNPSEWIFKAQ